MQNRTFVRFTRNMNRLRLFEKNIASFPAISTSANKNDQPSISKDLLPILAGKTPDYYMYC